MATIHAARTAHANAAMKIVRDSVRWLTERQATASSVVRDATLKATPDETKIAHAGHAGTLKAHGQKATAHVLRAANLIATVGAVTDHAAPKKAVLANVRAAAPPTMRRAVKIVRVVDSRATDAKMTVPPVVLLTALRVGRIARVVHPSDQAKNSARMTARAQDASHLAQSPAARSGVLAGVPPAGAPVAAARAEMMTLPVAAHRAAAAGHLLKTEIAAADQDVMKNEHGNIGSAVR